MYKLFWETLFDETEGVCVTATPYGTQMNMRGYVMHTNDNYFCINPLIGSRKDDNVGVLRNILVEMDNLPLDEQETALLGMPYTTKVFSGNKSFHYIISLLEPCHNRAEYDALVYRIYKKLAPNVDKANKNPSRLSRVPNAMRDNYRQTLFRVGPRVPKIEILTWLGPEEVVAPRPAPVSRLKKVLHPETSYFLAFGASEGFWNPSLFKAVCDMTRAGFDLEGIFIACENITGHLDSKDRSTIRSAYKKATGDL